VFLVGRDDQGRLDVLVNNAFALPEDLTEPGPFWEKPLSHWDMVDVGVRSNFVAARHAAKIMVPQESGLIVAISGYAAVTYTYGVVFGMCKSAVDRMARDMAVELEPHNIASLSLWQGLTFTERAERNLRRSPEMTNQTVTNPAVGCSPEFPGRGDRGAGGRSGCDEALGRHVHHRRVGRGVRRHRQRRQGHSLTARRAGCADLAPDRRGRPWTLTASHRSTGY
jgi:NAD(P)-dependent dehydrogenase (short-subunit alcohol dehydrogenase family)